MCDERDDAATPVARTSGIDTRDEATARAAALLYALSVATSPHEREYYIRMAFSAAQYDACARQQEISIARTLVVLARKGALR